MGIELKEGDKITFFISSTVGQRIRLSSRNGTFLRFFNNSKLWSVVKSKNGRELTIATGTIRLMDEPSALTEAWVAGLRGAHNG